MLKGTPLLASTSITSIICVGIKARAGTPNALLVLKVARLAPIAIPGLATALIGVLYEHRFWNRPPGGSGCKLNDRAAI